jgi:hypothetical protein
MGVFGTLDGGKTWAPFGTGLPPYPIVHDLLIHLRDNDLVVATHSRGIFIADIAPLQEATSAVMAKDAHLFAVEPKIQWPRRAIGGTIGGDRQFVAPNEPAGLLVNYFLKSETKDKVAVKLLNAADETVAVIEGKGAAGLNSVLWDFRRTGAQQQGASGQGGGAQAPAAPGPRMQPALAPPGAYTVVLEIGDKTLTTPATVRSAPERD